MFSKQIFAAFVYIVSGICCMVSPALADRVYLDFSAQDVRKIIVAVPSFSTDSPADTTGRTIAELLGNALELHGFIDIVEAARYGDAQQGNWQALGVDYVVVGQYARSGDDFTLEGRLLDVAENRLLAGRRYKGAPSQQEDMTLRLADALIEEFTGEPGVSRTSIAYISDATGRKEVYISDVLGRSQRQVTRHRHLCVSPRYTPDGGRLAYSTYHRGNQDLYITDLRQSERTRSLSRRKGMNLAPAFSPDGKHMILTLSKDGSPDLYLMNLEGRIIEQLTRNSGINVSANYSPDGNTIAFVSDRSGKPQIYTMNLSSRTVKRLTFQRSENSEPVWSPKGDRIAFTGLVDGRYQIFVMDTEGRNSRQLSSGWGDFESPSWAPDGKMIVFARKRNGKSDICLVGANGKNMRVLFTLKGNQSYPQWSPRPE